MSDEKHEHTATKAMDFYDVYYHRISPMYCAEIIKAVQKEMDSVGFDPESKDAEKMTADAMKWIVKQDESNNYMHNLKTACSLDHVTIKNIGLLASLFPTFNRELEYQKKREKEMRAERKSEYIGNVGDRIHVDVADVFVISSWDSLYGTTFIYKITDNNGNIYTWKTGKVLDDVKSLIGTVKDHIEFRGTKETELTRCRVVA